MLFIKVVGRTAHRSLLYFFHLVYLQSRKYDRSEMLMVDVNIPAMCNEGMRMAFAELSELITGNVVLSS